MSDNVTAIKGFADLFSPDSDAFTHMEAVARETFSRYGFTELRTPILERTELFCRGIGTETDVVQKEMFEVKGQKGKDVFALKPEGTAGAVRAALENGLLNDALPLKACYITPCFRHERPQAGRLREFHQFGCEVFGAKSPAADVELISLVDHILKLFGVKGIELSLNSIGCKTCRAEYHKALKAYFEQYKGELCETCLERLDKNPMRILDCKSPECKKIAENAPVVTDYLCDDCRAHFEAVQKYLTAEGVEFTVNPHIVRGLDYYTRTVFEFVSGDIGAQATVCGGGRYDGLIAQMGGPSVPSLGFAMGIERIMLLLEAQKTELPRPAPCDIYIAAMGDNAALKAAEICARLRQDGFSAQTDICGRGLKAQMKYADKTGAEFTMVLGDNELETGKARLKNMASGSETEVRLENLADELLSAIHSSALDNLADSILKQ